MVAVPEGGDRVPAGIVSGGRREEMREGKEKKVDFGRVPTRDV